MLAAAPTNLAICGILKKVLKTLQLRTTELMSLRSISTEVVTL